jgi:hypothetical protein
VDWNPPPGRARLADALPWPRGLRHVSIRVLEVSEAIHRRWPLHRMWNLFTVAAYNAGVRRARGEFVVLSMIDHLYPDELMSCLDRRTLQADRAYRVARADVDRAVLGVDGVDARLAFCKDHVLERTRPPEKPLHPELPPLFTDGCGDFQLLAREVWHRLRGYREADGMPQHVDAMVHLAAHAMGVREHVLDAVVYHIHHESGWTDRIRRREPIGSWRRGVGYVPPPASTRDRWASRWRRALLLETRPLPAERLWPRYRRLLADLGRGRRAHDWNDEHWGLGDDVLPERWIHRAEWDTA